MKRPLLLLKAVLQFFNFLSFSLQASLLKASHLKKVFCMIALLLCSAYNIMEAQAPVITKNIGIPSGNGNSKGVAYGNGVYVTALSNLGIYSSADGNTWSRATTPSTTLGAIAFGNGIFVIVGDNGLVLTSTDGTTWTSRTSNTTQNLLDVQYLNSAFYAVGNNRTLIKSTDGINWTTQTISVGLATDFMLSITYGAGTYIISSRSSTGGSQSQVYKSTTGASGSWTLQNLNIGTLNKVQWINNRFFVFFAGNQVYTSTDASTWTNVTGSITLTLPNTSSGTWNSNNQIFNGFYDGSKYYFFGSSEFYSGYGSVWTATTGLNLTLLTKTAYIVPQGSAYLNSKYFITGNEGIVSSTDGITFKYPTGTYMSAASSGTSYVGVGAISSNNGSIFTSSDFNNWTEKTPFNQQELYGVVYDGSKYVAVGNQTVIKSTDNGNTWSQIATPSDNKQGLAWGNSKYVAIGYGATGQITSSTDGIAWSTVDITDNWYFRVKYVNGKFFALGYDNTNYLGVIMYSSDGTTWSTITPNLPFSVYYFNDVVWDGTKYHFMGVEGSTFFSISTAIPTDPNSFANKGTIASPPGGTAIGGDWGQGAFAYSNGRFVGSANDVNNTYEAYVLYSADGVTWTAVDINEKTAIQSAITEGNTTRLMGMGDGKITVSFGLLAVDFLNLEGNLVNGESLIKWQTAAEQNTKDFVVQYCINGSNWNNIGIVNAVGTSVSVQQYAFTHKTPAKGVNSYRIMERDVNGKTTYSNIINIICKTNSKQLIVYPNPVTGNIVTLQLPAAATVTLYNSNGALVLNKSFKAGVQQLSLTGLAKGAYNIKAGEETRQIIIQ